MVSREALVKVNEGNTLVYQLSSAKYVKSVSKSLKIGWSVQDHVATQDLPNL